MATLWLRNLGFYSLQILLIAAAGGLLIQVLQIRMPKVRLYCWQVLLVVCFLLPAIQPWRRLNIDSSVQITTGAFTPVERNHSLGFLQIPLPNVILLLLGAGAAIRFSILGLGFLRLRRYRRDSSIVPGAFHDLERRMGIHADVHVSPDTPGPVTFGFLHPVILLPEACLQDESIACHELLHVRRYDWLFTVLEECALALFWFHPAMWWLIAQIQLTREEAVDRGAVAILNSRERYLESLLALATAKVGMDLVPASPFLRRRHLQKRVASLLKEVSMSKLRLSWSLATFVAALALAGWLGVRSFPLQAAPQEKPDETVYRIGDEGVTPPKVLSKTEPEYTAEARDAKIEGAVVLSLQIDADGLAQNIQIMRSLDSGLDQNAVAAIQQWRFEPGEKNGKPVRVAAKIEVNFRLN
jgi:TonB family protein